MHPKRRVFSGKWSLFVFKPGKHDWNEECLLSLCSEFLLSDSVLHRLSVGPVQPAGLHEWQLSLNFLALSCHRAARQITSCLFTSRNGQSDGKVSFPGLIRRSAPTADPRFRLSHLENDRIYLVQTHRVKRFSINFSCLLYHLKCKEQRYKQTLFKNKRLDGGPNICWSELSSRIVSVTARCSWRLKCRKWLKRLFSSGFLFWLGPLLKHFLTRYKILCLVDFFWY